MRYLKQSTAATVKIGPFVDATDGVTAETGLTISQADVRLAKDGGNYAQKTESSASTHDELGEYDCDLDATDTATLGSLVLSVQESGALPVRHEFTVLAANVYDSIVGGGDILDTSVTQWLGTACATPTTAGVPEVDATFFDGEAVPATAQTGALVVDIGYIGGTAVTESAGTLEVNTTEIGGSAVVHTTGLLSANVTQWLGTAAATPTVAGVPEVDVTHQLGVAVATAYQITAEVARSDDGLTDMWLVSWYENGVASSAVTSGTFAVMKASDGVAFFADAAATTVGNNRTRRSITTTLIEPDEIYLVTATATIDSGARQAFAQLSGAALLQTIGRAGTTAVATSADLKASLTATDAAIATVDANVDAILVDTGTTLPATLATIDGIADAILVDTGTTIPGTIATVDANVDAILLDTAEIGAAGAGLTALGTAATISTQIQSDLATEIGRIDAAVSSRSAAGDAMALTTGERSSTATAILDLTDGVETGITMRQSLRYIAAALAGQAAGLDGTTVTFRAIDNAGTTRITATVDSDGNRSSVTLG